MRDSGSENAQPSKGHQQVSGDSPNPSIETLFEAILEAEDRGEMVDPTALIAENPHYADLLRGFFARRDLGERRRWSNSAGQGGAVRNTVGGARAPATQVGGVVSDGLGGIAFSLILAVAGAIIGFTIADVQDHKMSEYFLHIPLLVTKLIGAMIGASIGAIVGFPIGVFVNYRARTP